MRKFFKIFGSLKIAVSVLVGMVVALAAGTILESQYDTQTAKYFVYSALWFRAILVLFGINIFCVAMTRWPWQRKHTAFLLAHAGILMVLAGSWLTDRYGIDGNLVLTEGQTSGFLELPENVLVVRDPTRPAILPIPWLPASRGSQIIEFRAEGLRIAEWIAHAEIVQEFEAAADGAPAIEIEMSGGPIGPTQSLWLYGGSARQSTATLGPAEFVLLPEGLPFSEDPGRARLEFSVKQGRLSYTAFSSKSKPVRGVIDAQGPQEISVPWMKGPGAPRFRRPLKVSVKAWLPAASDRSRYMPSRIQYGDQAPPPAIRVQGDPGHEVWLGFSERGFVQARGTRVELEFMPKYSVLPFSLKLERFEISRYEGSVDPSSYKSTVRVLTEKGESPDTDIAMNTPLKFGGYTFYQASFVPGEPRPTTTILSVNQDPGRSLKYLGSAVLVLGCILLFARKYQKLQSRDLFPSG